MARNQRHDPCKDCLAAWPGHQETCPQHPTNHLNPGATAWNACEQALRTCCDPVRHWLDGLSEGGINEVRTAMAKAIARVLAPEQATPVLDDTRRYVIADLVMAGKDTLLGAALHMADAGCTWLDVIHPTEDRVVAELIVPWRGVRCLRRCTKAEAQHANFHGDALALPILAHTVDAGAVVHPAHWLQQALRELFASEALARTPAPRPDDVSDRLLGDAKKLAALLDQSSPRYVPSEVRYARDRLVVRALRAAHDWLVRE